MKTNKGLYTVLTLCGSIPFIVAVILLHSQVTTIPIVGNTLHAIIIYSLMIASFMAGVHWAQYLKENEKIAINLFISSNIMVLALWLFYLLTPIYVLLVVFIIDYAVLLIFDMILCKLKVIKFSYFIVRLLVTIIVMVSLVYYLMVVLNSSNLIGYQ